MLRFLAHSTVAVATLLVALTAPGLTATTAAADSAAGCSKCGRASACPSCNQCQTGCQTCGKQHGCRNACGKCQTLNCRARQYGQPNLFGNYYVPGTCGGQPAALYVAPRPVPANVGQTYFTYQPFLPHELLYQHDRTYYRYYDNGRGMNRTRISWYRPMIPGTVSNVARHFRLAK